MNVWFTGCTHYGHANMIRLANRPFGSVEEMDEVMIERHNKLVKDTDLVYHLGDVCWHKKQEQRDALRLRLKGNIFLVHGNHDSREVRAEFNSVDYRELHETGPHGLVLFHYPIEDWNGRWRGSIHLHAHTHDKTFERPNIPRVPETTFVKDGETVGGLPLGYPPDVICNRFHVGVDATAFAPVSLDEIVSHSRGEVPL